MAAGEYLRRRPQGWVFRCAIAQKLRERFGQGEVVRSLARVPQSQAASESLRLRFAFEDLFVRARSDETLTQDQLRGFATAIANDRREALTDLQSTIFGCRDLRQDAYETHRDVAILAMEAISDRKSIFDRNRIVEFATEAGISNHQAVVYMPLLQQAFAHGAAAFSVELARSVKPTPRPASRWLQFLKGCIDPRDVKFEVLGELFDKRSEPFGPLIQPDGATSGAAQTSPDPNPSGLTMGVIIQLHLMSRLSTAIKSMPPPYQHPEQMSARTQRRMRTGAR